MALRLRVVYNVEERCGEMKKVQHGAVYFSDSVFLSYFCILTVWVEDGSKSKVQVQFGGLEWVKNTSKKIYRPRKIASFCFLEANSTISARYAAS